MAYGQIERPDGQPRKINSRKNFFYIQQLLVLLLIYQYVSKLYKINSFHLLSHSYPCNYCSIWPLNFLSKIFTQWKKQFIYHFKICTGFTYSYHIINTRDILPFMLSIPYQLVQLSVFFYKLITLHLIYLLFGITFFILLC